MSCTKEWFSKEEELKELRPPDPDDIDANWENFKQQTGPENGTPN